MASGQGSKARIVLQQCLSARLQVQPATEDTEAKYVEIGKGLVMYVCFLNGATADILDKMGNISTGKTKSLFSPMITLNLFKKFKFDFSGGPYLPLVRSFFTVCLYILSGGPPDTSTVKCVLSAQLSETGEGKRVSVLELPGNVLIIPQATLGGSLKGKRMQYHRNIDKGEGASLYADFVSLCRTALQETVCSQEAGCVVQAGTYGNRQVFSCDTNGPYTHLLEF